MTIRNNHDRHLHDGPVSVDEIELALRVFERIQAEEDTLAGSEETPWLATLANTEAPSRLRAMALRAITDHSPDQAVETALRALQDPDSGVRRTAARILGKLGNPQAVPELSRLLEDREAEVRNSAVIALSRLGAVDPLLQERGPLADEDWRVRTITAQELGEFKQAATVPALASALQDPDEEVRLAAATALGKQALDAGVRVLNLTVQRADDWRVRLSAIEGLMYVGTDEAVTTLIAALKDPVLPVRIAAAEALGELAAPEAAEALREASMDRDSDLRTAAAQALSMLPPEAMPPVRLNADAATDRLRRELERLSDSLRNALQPALQLLRADLWSDDEISKEVWSYDSLDTGCKANARKDRKGNLRFYFRFAEPAVAGRLLELRLGDRTFVHPIERWDATEAGVRFTVPSSQAPKQLDPIRFSVINPDENNPS